MNTSDTSQRLPPVGWVAAFWLVLWLLRPRFRRAWAIFSVVVVVVSLAGDGVARLLGGSGLARNLADLWLSVVFGALLGVAGAIAEWWWLTAQGDRLLEYFVAAYRGQLPHRQHFWNWLWALWFLVGVAVLIMWSFNEVVVLPAIFATNAVQFACNNRILQGFNIELADLSRESAPPPSEPDSAHSAAGQGN